MTPEVQTKAPVGPHGDALLGKVIQGQYRIIERIAKGGMAWIYRAEHRQLRQDVAVKILFPQLLEEPELCERFLDEARIQFGLKHPNIIGVMDVISEGTLVGIVLEWINGHDLRRWIKAYRQPFTATQLREVMLPVVDAVGYAHEKGIIHRDLKPGNILFHHEGKRFTPKVADFGIAKTLDEVDSQTKTGTMMGTLQYMSPEQIRDSKYVDQRSDIYSLGVILFRLATGRLPFREKAPLALMRAHETTPPPIPSSINPEVPPQLDDILLCCLAKHPSGRYKDCGELYEELAQLPEADAATKASLFPAELMKPRPVMDPLFPTGEESNPPLPTGFEVVESTDSGASHSSIPAPSSVSQAPRELDTFIERPQAPAPVFPLNESLEAGEALDAISPPEKDLRSTVADPELSQRVHERLEQESKKDAAARALSMSQQAGPPTKPGSRLLPMLLLLLVLGGGGVGTYVFLTSRPATTTKAIVDSGPARPAPPRRPEGPSPLQMMNDYMTKAMIALAAKKLDKADDLFRKATTITRKGSKAPIWKETAYYPRLYATRALLESQRGNYFSASIFARQYKTADMSGKSAADLAAYKARKARLDANFMDITKELQKRMAKAEKLLSRFEKLFADINKGKGGARKLDRAFAVYEKLRGTVKSVPTVYRKVAISLKDFFPDLSLSIYSTILDKMQVSDALAAKLRKEKDALQKDIDKRRDALRGEFSQNLALAKSGKVGRVVKWLKNGYRQNQSFGVFHQNMSGLLKALASRDIKGAKKVLRAYMTLFRRYTQKSLVRWAKTSKIPLELPTYQKLEQLKSDIVRWQRLKARIRRTRSALRSKNIRAAASYHRSFPKNWRGWFAKDDSGFYTYVSKGMALRRNYDRLGQRLRKHLRSDQLYARTHFDKAIASYLALKKQLETTSLGPFAGKKELARWRALLDSRIARCKRGKAMLAKARSLRWRKKWNECHVAYKKIKAQFPQSAKAKWLEKQRKLCHCNTLCCSWLSCEGLKGYIGRKKKR